MDADTLEAMTVLLELPSIWNEREKYLHQNKDDKEEFDMCQAVREWAEEERNIGRTEGRREGRRQGEDDKAFTIVKNLLHRGTSEEEIMLITECDREFVTRVRSTI